MKNYIVDNLILDIKVELDFILDLYSIENLQLTLQGSIIFKYLKLSKISFFL